MSGSSTPALLAGFVDLLPVDGGSITVISRGRLSSTIAVTDPIASLVDGLQLDLDEGPRWQAYSAGAPVLVPDVAQQAARESWPLFSAAIAALSVRGVFAFPLQIGVLTVGVVDLYSETHWRSWTAQQVDDGVRLAAATARPALRSAARSASAAQSTAEAGAAELSREIHQATGFLVVWLDLSPADAVARLQGYAFAAGRPVLDVARDVVARRLNRDAFE